MEQSPHASATGRSPYPIADDLGPLGHASSVGDADFNFLRNLIYQRARINLGPEKRQLVATRLNARIRETGCASFHEYCLRLRHRDSNREIERVVDALTTNHTYFFREAEHLEFLAQVVRSEDSPGPRRLDIWSCACATGEEPYSIAIKLASIEESDAPFPWRIECSDISENALRAASRGVYSRTEIDNLDAVTLSRYFQKCDDGMGGRYRVVPSLRRQLRFSKLNLFDVSYPWRQKFSAIFCRNVMIYFDRQSRQQLVSRLATCLHPGGYLFIGHAESLAGINHPYELVRPAVYRLPI